MSIELPDKTGKTIYARLYDEINSAVYDKNAGSLNNVLRKLVARVAD